VLYTVNLLSDLGSWFASELWLDLDVNPEPLNIEPLNGFNVLTLL
jgi:hypothetical protein